MKTFYATVVVPPAADRRNMTAVVTTVLTNSGRVETFSHYDVDAKITDSQEARNYVERRLLRAFPGIKHKMHGSIVKHSLEAENGGLVVTVMVDYDD